MKKTFQVLYDVWMRFMSIWKSIGMALLNSIIQTFTGVNGKVMGKKGDKDVALGALRFWDHRISEIL